MIALLQLFVPVLLAQFGEYGEVIAWTTAIVGGISTLLTLLFTRGIDAFSKWRNTAIAEKIADGDQELKERQYEDTQANQAQERLVEELTSQIAALRAECVSSRAEMSQTRKEYIDAVRMEERTRGQYEMAQAEIIRLNGEIQRLHKLHLDQSEEIKSLREWRHTIANAEHAALLKLVEAKVATAEKP